MTAMRFMNLIRTGPALVALTLALAGGGALAQARSFQAEGADAGVGLGARYIALGGTGVALADDLHAAWYNPAGLVAVKRFELSVSRQLDARLHAVNALGAAWKLPLPEASGLQMTVGGLYYPRIHARASGAFTEDDVESIFLRYLLPGISGTFDGHIDSKTKSTRVAMGLSPAAGSRWSAGAYVERIDCKSSFCGVHATSNGYTESSTGAKATGFGFGLRFMPQPEWTVGLAISDARTRLDIETVTTDAAGTRQRLWDARFPRKLAIEVAHQWSGRTRWAAGAEVTRGAYGSNELDLQVVRLGLEHLRGPWTWRAGALVPLKIASADTGELKLPAPLAPSLGLGWRQGPVAIDAALYAHPVMSLHKDRVSPTMDLTLSLRY
jgi:hypothetical protein